LTNKAVHITHNLKIVWGVLTIVQIIYNNCVEIVCKTLVTVAMDQ